MYPDLDDVKFLDKISSKKEFAKFKTDPVDVQDNDYHQIAAQECSRGPFRLTANQILLRNFLSPVTPYNGVLLFHGLGVGKTCTSITIAEQFSNLFPNQTIVLMPKNLKDNFRSQVSGPCGKRKYLMQQVDKKYIDSKYTLYGYQEFANKIQDLKEQLWSTYGSDTDDDNMFGQQFGIEIKKLFSNRVIIMDEVHNIRSDEDQTDKKTPQRILDMLLFAENVKLIMLSATPMYNSHKEIIWLLNYLLANDKRPRIDTSDVFNDKDDAMNRKLLLDVSRGYVSYIKGENPFSFPIIFFPQDHMLLRSPVTDLLTGEPLKTPIDMLKDKLLVSTFSPFQKTHYHRYLNNQNVFGKLVQISNIMFPCGGTRASEETEDLGKEALMNCFSARTVKGNMQVSYKSSMETMFLKQPHLAKYSCKINTVLDKISSSEGTVLVYSNYLDSGIIPLAIALEHKGFRRSLGSPSLLANTGEQVPYAGTYSFLTKDNRFNVNIGEEVKEINAGRVKVVMGTSIAAEGLDLKNVREVHILEPWHHLNRIRQVIGRAQRKCSHVSLPASKRNVTVYLHAAASSYESEKESIDLRMYRMGEEKQNKIDAVQQTLMSNSIDCVLNREYNTEQRRFILDTVKTSQGRILKDVDIYKHQGFLRAPVPEKCVSSPVVSIDDSTFDTYFLSEEIQELSQQVKNYFSSSPSGTLDQISYFTGEDQESLEFALKILVREGTEILLNKRPGYLIKTKDGKYLFQPQGIDPNIPLTDGQRLGKEPVMTETTSVPLPRNLNAVNRSQKNGKIDLDKAISAFDIPFKNRLLKRSYQVFVDYHVDRLDQEDLKTLTVQVLKNDTKHNQHAMKSLVSGGHLFEYQTEGEVSNWALVAKGEYYIWAGDDWRKAESLEVNQVIKPPPLKSLENALGYFHNRAGKFYIIHKQNNKGTVCGNGVVSSRYLYSKIQELEPEFFGKDFDLKQITKRQLCKIYELLLRSTNLFVRKSFV